MRMSNFLLFSMMRDVPAVSILSFVPIASLIRMGRPCRDLVDLATTALNKAGKTKQTLERFHAFSRRQGCELSVLHLD